MKVLCEVCGNESDAVICSVFGAISYATCADCATKGIEPYDNVVGAMLHFDEFGEGYKTIAENSIKYAGKTIEEFNRDVDELCQSYYDFLENEAAATAEEIAIEEMEEM